MEKLKLILVLVFIGLIIAATTLFNQNKALRKQNDMHLINDKAQYEQIKSLSITREQLEERLKHDKKMDSIVSSLNVRLKNIKTITTTEYIFKRDTIQIPVIKDSVNHYTLSYNSECLSFGGSFNTESLELNLTNFNYNDSIYHVAYMKRKPTGKKFLFFNLKRKVLDLHTSTKCGEVRVEQLNILKE